MYKRQMHDMPDHKEGVNFVFKCLLDPEIGAIKDLKEIDAVGPVSYTHLTLKAADKVLADDLADIILIGNPANIKNLAAQ